MSVQKALNQFPAGSRIRIEKLSDCPKARGRLCALGLTPGTTVEMCSCGPGPCVLKVRGTSVCIGKGMARSVFGTDADSPASKDPLTACQEQALAHTG